MQVTNMETENTYIFTEKDMPGFETKPEKDGPPIPSRLLYAARNEKRQVGKDGKYVYQFRKAIPSE